MTMPSPQSPADPLDVPYTSQPFTQSHPRRLATIAWLHGVPTAPPNKCRVLELGCASGGNLLPMAWQLPDSRFVGLDLSSKSIDEAEKLAREFGLANVEFLRHDIAEPAPQLGLFDYIVVHGVFSWVAPEIQRRLLEWLDVHLAPKGVAYVSYNTMPGWSFRAAVRDLIRFAADPTAAPATQVADGRKLLELAARSRPPERSPWGNVLAAELKRLAPQPEDYVWHEFLTPHNRPLYFQSFLSLAEDQGLQFLGEADYGSEAVVDLPPEAIESLPSVDGDWRRREQMLDFLRWQPFRQSLLCRRDVSVARQVDASRMESLYVAGDMAVESGEVSGHSAHAAQPSYSTKPLPLHPSLTFISQSSRLTTNHPLTKCAMSILARTYPRYWPFTQLRDESARLLSTSPATEHASRELAESLLRAYATRLIDLSIDEPACGSLGDDSGGPKPQDGRRPEHESEHASERRAPRASASVRRQALTGKPITNRLHQLVSPDGFQRFVLTLLDGRSLEDIVGALEIHSRQGVTLFDDAGRPVVDAARIRDVLSATLDRTLRQLARQALLEPHS